MNIMISENRLYSVLWCYRGAKYKKIQPSGM